MFEIEFIDRPFVFCSNKFSSNRNNKNDVLCLLPPMPTHLTSFSINGCINLFPVAWKHFTVLFHHYFEYIRNTYISFSQAPDLLVKFPEHDNIATRCGMLSFSGIIAACVFFSANKCKVHSFGHGCDVCYFAISRQYTFDCYAIYVW